jgi:hypothetical protein
LNKPEKIYLNNPNLIGTLAETQMDKGTMRETFFINQLSVLHSVNWSESSDFFVDHKYTFEIGGKNKNRKQITSIDNAYLAVDDIEFAQLDKIPLWLFGFLY